MSENPYSVESTGIADTVFQIGDDTDVKIMAIHADADFGAWMDEQDAARNALADDEADDAPRQPTDAEIDACLADVDRTIAFEKRMDVLEAQWKAEDAAKAAPVVTVRPAPEYRDVDDNATDALGRIDPLAAIAFTAFLVGRLTRPLTVDAEGRVFSPLKFTCGGEAEAFGMLIAEFNAAQQADAPAGRIEPGTDTLTAA